MSATIGVMQRLPSQEIIAIHMPLVGFIDNDADGPPVARIKHLSNFVGIVYGT